MPFSSSVGFAALPVAVPVEVRAAGGRVVAAGIAAPGSRPVVEPLGVELEVAADAARGGQITPPHVVSLHLKSGAFGFRFPSRLSHMGPWHLGQLGTGDSASGVRGWLIAIAAGRQSKVAAGAVAEHRPILDFSTRIKAEPLRHFQDG